MVPDLLRDVPDNWLAKDFTDITVHIYMAFRLIIMVSLGKMAIGINGK